MILKKILLLLITLLTVISTVAQSQDNLVSERVNSMTQKEKFWQLYMIPGNIGHEDHDYSNGIFGLQIQPPLTAYDDAVQTNKTQRYFIEQSKSGIPIIPFEEALHGLKRPGATVFPQAISLAASWDTELMHKVSLAAARETRSRGIRMVLSPVVNIASDVRWGRTEETYGEDPYLTSRMAKAFVTAFEKHGIVTTPKHFVANVGDGGRDSWPVSLDKRTLMEIHYPPFKAAFDSGARSAMTAYNSVDGVPATQNHHLLTEVLKEKWAFEGFVISDMAATGGATVLHRTEPSTPVAGANAYKAGLDVVFQSSWPQHTPYLQSFTSGLVPDEVTDAAVERILSVKQQLGLFDNPYVDPDSAAYWNGHENHMKLAREAAAAGMVLLKNDRDLLPLTSNPQSILVVGNDAAEARLGGYSGPGIAPVSILDGLKARFGDAVTFLPGIRREKSEYEVVPAEYLSLNVSYFDNPELSGEPVATGEANLIDNRWTFNSPAPGMSTEWYSVRWEGTLTVGEDPVTQLGIEGDDGWRLYVDGELFMDNWEKVSYDTTLKDIDLQPGSTHSIMVEYFETTGDARIRLIWDAGVEDRQPELIREAVARADKSELAIVVAGIEEGEFRDRAFLGLPGYQEELIEALAKTDTRIIVVLVGGSAITMPWLDKADAVIMAWYPGEQGGHGLADVLTGAVNPSGRLPVTFPQSEGQLPLVYNHRPTGRGNDYLDLSGKPLFPFGYGLSYTSFKYSNITLKSDTIGVDEEVTVSLDVTNTGSRAGHEVVQLYIRDMLASVARPVRALKGFDRIFLEPGESKTVTFTLGREELKMVNRDLNWVVEPGAFRIYVGASSRDIRLMQTLVVE